MTKRITHISQTPISLLPQKQLDEMFRFFRQLRGKNETALCALSGGPDSMFLASLAYLWRAEGNGRKLIFVHCNHGIRKESKKEAEFLKGFLEGEKLFVFEREKGKEDEQTLRSRRYECFLEVAEKENANLILMGHNLTDRIESTFLNLLRGAGKQGFLAMTKKETHHLLRGKTVGRPLLEFTKQEIEERLKIKHIPFVVDQSNFDPEVSMRNKLRNDIFPQIFALSHKSTPETNTFLESMKHVYYAWEQEKEQKREKVFLREIGKSPYWNADFAYERKVFHGAITQEHLCELWKHLGLYQNVTTPLLNERVQWIQKGENGWKVWKGITFFLAGGCVFFIKAKERFWEKEINISVIAKEIGTLEIGEETINIKKEALLGAIIRFPRKGDSFRRKTWNTWCINNKIPLFRRNFIPLAEKEGKIILPFKEVLIK